MLPIHIEFLSAEVKWNAEIQDWIIQKKFVICQDNFTQIIPSVSHITVLHSEVLSTVL